jgi:hypothetical protein
VEVVQEEKGCTDNEQKQENKRSKFHVTFSRTKKSPEVEKQEPLRGYGHAGVTNSRDWAINPILLTKPRYRLKLSWKLSRLPMLG